MCRYIAYMGDPIRMADLVTEPENSLVSQSYKIKEVRNLADPSHALNADGFGMGWYPTDKEKLGEDPCVFTAITPAWSNRNLRRLAKKTLSGCFFAHVRSATQDSMVDEANCHPFKYGNYLWMHNGYIPAFQLVKRRLRNQLSDTAYLSIQGTTDSEHAFAYFLDKFPESGATENVQALIDALTATIYEICELTKKAGIEQPGRYNFVVSDGQHVVGSRYADGDTPPPTLFLSEGQEFKADETGVYASPFDSEPNMAIISSERLSKGDNWKEVPPNHLFSLTQGGAVQFHQI